MRTSRKKILVDGLDFRGNIDNSDVHSSKATLTRGVEMLILEYLSIEILMPDAACPLTTTIRSIVSFHSFDVLDLSIYAQWI